METIYGKFDASQIDAYKVAIHKRIHKLLIFKDPALKSEFTHVDFDLYFFNLMREISGFNEMTCYTEPVVELMAVLQAALMESRSAGYDWKTFRRMILAAHSLVDKIGREGGGGND